MKHNDEGILNVLSDIKTVKNDKETIFYQSQSNEISLFEHAFKHQLPVMIKGPTGCGKTRFVSYMAEKLNRPLYTVSCHDDLSAADLIGRHLIGPDGTYWQDGPLTKAVREGGICYLDEIVEARKDTTVVIHPLTDDRRILPLERTGELLQASPDFMLVISYNPGYQNLLKGLKPSTKQRFVGMQFDYPEEETEINILMNEAKVDSELASKVVGLANALRRLENHDLDEMPSTRLLIYTAVLINSGVPAIEACLSCLASPLTDDPQITEALLEVVKVYFE